MAIITKIREKAGVAVGAVAVALGLFIVGSDLITGNNKLFGNSNTVGEIAGEEVDYEVYQNEIAKMESDYYLQNQKTPGEQEAQGLREQAWNQLVFTKLFGEEYDKLGIQVTQEELIDMVQGENIHPSIKQSFADPNTKEFSKKMLIDFLKNIEGAAKKDQQFQIQYASWINFERKLPEDRMRTKVEGMLKGSLYATKEEAKREHFNQNARADIKLMFVPYFDIPDSTVKPTEEQLSSYFSENKKKYKATDNRAVEYLMMRVEPSKVDTNFFFEELTAIKDQFATTDNDTAFAASKSDGPVGLQALSPSSLPAELNNVAGGVQKGQVYGPYIAGSKYTVYKVVDVVNEGAFEAKASHILFKWNSAADADKKAALDNANKILADIKKGASFEDMARIHGTDGTAPNGGDLGWFGEGRMVKAFETAIFGAKATGLLPKPVETEFGYHLIKITAVKTNLKYKVVAIEKNITAGDQTKADLYAKASDLKSKISNRATFNEQAKANPKWQRLTFPSVMKTSYGINEIQDARPLVRWAFEQKDTGAVSELYEFNDRYVIAIVTKVSNEGEPKMDDFRETITAEVLKDLKAKKIIEKLGSGNLEAMAQKYGPSCKLVDNPNVTLISAAIPELGYDPKAIGKIFGMKDGKETKAFKAENGVAAIRVTKIYEVPQVADYNQYKVSVQSKKTGMVQYHSIETLKDIRKVSDNRIKFY